MKKENEMLQTTLRAGGYVAPAIKVYAARKRAVLCASGYTELSEEGDTSGWY